MLPFKLENGYRSFLASEKKKDGLYQSFREEIGN